MTPRNVKVEIFIDGVFSPRSFSILPYYNDSTLFTQAEGRLMGPLTYSVSVRTWLQSETTQSTISNIKIANGDGALDDFADETMTTVNIYEIIDGVETKLASGQVKRASLDGENHLIIQLKDAISILNVPLQDVLFPASEPASSDGLITNTYYTLEGKPRPISLGQPQQVPPVWANPSIDEFHIHEDTYALLRFVYDKAVDVSANATQYAKGFDLSVSPVGKILAMVNGPLMPDLITVRRNLPNVLEWIFDKIGFTDYSTTDLDDIQLIKGHRYAYYQDDTTNIIVFDLVKWICDSHTGWFYTDENGQLRFGYLKDPEVIHDVEVRPFNIIKGINVFDDTAPNFTAEIGANRNWYVMDQGEVGFGAITSDKIAFTNQFRQNKTGVGTPDPFYTDTGQRRDTLLRRNYQEEADNVVSLYSQKRKFYAFDSNVSANIGDTVKVTYPRFGLDSGVNLLCVGKTIDFISNTYRLILWG